MLLKQLFVLLLLLFSGLLQGQNSTLADSLLMKIENSTRHYNWSEAIFYGEQLDALLENMNDNELKIKFHKTIATAYANIADVDGFTANIDTALAIIDTQFDSIHLLRYELLNTRISFTAFFDFPTSEVFLQQFGEYIDRYPNEAGYANYLRRKGASSAIQKQFFSAIDYYEQSFQIGGFNSIRQEAEAYQNVAYFYTSTWQKEKGFSYAIKAVELLEKEDITDHLTLAKLYNTLSSLSVKGNKRAGLQKRILYAQAAKKHAYLADNADQVLFASLSLVSHNLYSFILYPLDSIYWQNALEFNDSIGQIQATFIKEYGPPNRNYTRLSNDLFIDFYLRVEDEPNAREYLENTLTLLGSVPELEESIEANTRVRMARLSLLEGNPYWALEHIQAAICMIIPKGSSCDDYYKNYTVEVYQEHLLSSRLLLIKAKAFFLAYQQGRQLKDLNGARETFLLWDSLVKRADDVERIMNFWDRPYINLGYQIFYNYAQLQDKSASIQAALIYAEQQKNYSFLERIGEQEIELRSIIPDSVRFKKGLLKEQLDGLKSRTDILLAANEDSKALLASKEENAKKQEYLEYLDFIQKKYPTDATFNKKIIEFDTAKIASYIGALKSETVVEYVIGKEAIYAIILNESGSKILELEGSSASLIQLIADFRTKLTNREEDYSSEAKEIYRRLFLPLLSYLSSKDLIIVPDLELMYLPFDLLMDEKGRFVIEEYAIRYVYSLIWEQYEREKSTTYNNGQILAIAASPEMETYASLYQDATRDQLRHLPGATAEVNQLSKLLNGDFVIEHNATESYFKKVANNYAVLHLATHAIINDDVPSQSRLVFVQEQIEEQDAYLNAYEIANMKLKADLITLSACNSGVGNIKDGEGVQSLAAAFAYAGCPNSVSSLWTVHDKSAADIMTVFYKNLLAGMPKYKALRAAKIAYLKVQPDAKKHPYYWGGFVYYGNGQPILLTKKESNNVWIWGILAVIIGLLARFFYTRIE